MSRFSLHTVIYQMNRDEMSQEEGGGETKHGYSQVLTQIQNMISSNHAAELADILYKPGAEMKIKSLIIRYINQNRLAVEGIDNISELTDRIYNDMSGVGILTKYIENEEVEEININGPASISVQYPDRIELLQDHFSSATECVNIVKKMARSGGKILDQSSPIGDSYVARGIRMSGAIEPCVDKNIGAIASIRKQRPAMITRENLITWGTATAEELDLLELCINHGVSLAIAGATSSGKTSDMGYLLEQIRDKRIVMIEDTREINLYQHDESGRMIRDVVQMLTKEPPNAVTMQELLKLSLRLHPEVLVPAEMRGEEALTAQEAGRTGHTVLTSLHANSALSAYDRILTMTQMAPDIRLSENRLLRNVVEAFPLIVYKKRLADGSRKYMEIFEGLGVGPDGVVLGQAIYRFVVEGYERMETEAGAALRVKGNHMKVGNLSKRLAAKLYEGGVPLAMVQYYAGNDFVPEEIGVYAL
jgi:pilus assembly protein CpaF